MQQLPRPFLVDGAVKSAVRNVLTAESYTFAASTTASSMPKNHSRLEVEHFVAHRMILVECEHPVPSRGGPAVTVERCLQRPAQTLHSEVNTDRCRSAGRAGLLGTV